MLALVPWDSGTGWHWEAMSSGTVRCSVMAVPCGVAVGASIWAAGMDGCHIHSRAAPVLGFFPFKHCMTTLI